MRLGCFDIRFSYIAIQIFKFVSYFLHFFSLQDFPAPTVMAKNI